jgi:acetyltransferase
MIIDFPEIKEVDINPLAVVGREFVALDAVIMIDRNVALGQVEPHSHLVIEPYPREYVEPWILADGRPVTLRPIRPEDEPLGLELFKTFSEDTCQRRFFGPARRVTHEDMVRDTNIDYRREVALVAELYEDGKRKLIGMATLTVDPDWESGEFGVVVGDPWQGLGIGTKLVDMIIGVAEDKKLTTVRAVIRSDNSMMQHICREMGFVVGTPVEGETEAVLQLR